MGGKRDLVAPDEVDRLEVAPALADHVPPGAELLEVLAVRRPGLLVARVAVQRLSAMGDLVLAVGPLDPAAELRVQPGPGLDPSLAVDGELRGPGGGAGVVARVLTVLVRHEAIQR